MSDSRPKGFIWLNEWEKLTEELTNEQLGEMFRAVMRHANGKEVQLSKDQSVRLTYGFITNAIDHNYEKYEEICRKRAEAGKKGRAKQLGQMPANADTCQQVLTSGANINPNTNLNPNTNPNTNPNPNQTPLKGCVNTPTPMDEDFKTYGLFGNVKLTDSQLQMLKMKFAEQGLGEEYVDRCIEKLSSFMAQEGKTYQNHAAAILSWVKVAVLEDDRKMGAKPTTDTDSYEQQLHEQVLRTAWDNSSEQDRQQWLSTHDGLTVWEWEKQHPNEPLQ